LVLVGVVACTEVLALVARIVLLLGLVTPCWPSALIVGAVMAAVGAFLAVKGANALRREGPAPRKTVEIFKENGEWLKNQPGG
jgi:putative superfamily III holin-X